MTEGMKEMQPGSSQSVPGERQWHKLKHERLRTIQKCIQGPRKLDHTSPGGFTHQVGEALRNSAWSQSWACSGQWLWLNASPYSHPITAWIVLWYYDLYLMYRYMSCRTQPGSSSKWSVKWLVWRLVPSVMINMSADGEPGVFPVCLCVLRPSFSKYFF